MLVGVSVLDLVGMTVMLIFRRLSKVHMTYTLNRVKLDHIFVVWISGVVMLVARNDMRLI
jgi:hypothetical protein